MSDKPEIGKAITISIENNFENIPKNTRNELLVKLSKNAQIHDYFMSVIKAHLNEVPTSLRNTINK